MIYLIVGKPRSGKSYYMATKLVPRLQKAAQAKGKKFRLISNIRGHVDADVTIDFQDDFTDRKYDNSTLILDEVQYFSARDNKGLMFQHFTTHGHQGRDYYWITQSVAAIPRKWQGLVEKTIKIEPVAGSSISRAIHYIGIPRKGDMPMEVETYRPGPTDKYKTVEDGAEVPKRRMPGKVWALAAACVCAALAAPVAAYAVYKHFTTGNIVAGLAKEKAAEVSHPSLSPPKPVQFSAASKSVTVSPVEAFSSPVKQTKLSGVEAEIAKLGPLDDFHPKPKPQQVFIGCGGTYFSDVPVTPAMCKDAEEEGLARLSEHAAQAAVAMRPRLSAHPRRLIHGADGWQELSRL